MANLGGPNRLLNSAEVGELLGLPERTIRAEWKRWGLHACRVGRAIRWRERDCRDLGEGREDEIAPIALRDVVVQLDVRAPVVRELAPFTAASRVPTMTWRALRRRSMLRLPIRP
jgi:hypothetical protein